MSGLNRRAFGVIFCFGTAIFFERNDFALALKNITSRMREKYRNTMRKSPRARFNMRAKAMFAVLIILTGLVSWNLFRIQVKENDYYRALAEDNQLRDTVVNAERGVIYDANGTVLAQSASVWKIYINPNSLTKLKGVDEKVIENFKADVCRKLSDITGVDYDVIFEKINRSNRQNETIKTQVEFAEKEEIAKLRKEVYKYNTIVKSRWGKTETKERTIKYNIVVGIEPDAKRYYPYSNFASHVIGYYSNGEGVGKEGLESFYNDELSGIPGRIITSFGGNSMVSEEEYETVYDAQMGTSLVLTLDEVIQRYLEDSLRQVHKENGSVGAYGIVMDVNTGAIKALACIDDYNLNDPQHLEQEDYEFIAKEGENPDTELLDKNQKAEILKAHPDDVIAQAALRRKYIQNDMLYKIWSNSIIGSIYYPGSVFKTITLSAAVEENVVNPDEKFYCHGYAKVAGETMNCHKRGGHGSQTLTQGLENSCNPFFIDIGQRLGSEKFYEYFEAFGFTEKTGIDLPGEAVPKAGRNYYTKEKLGIVELSSCAFGQSLQVTPVQIITAISAIANGGKLMTPYIVAKQLDAKGNVISETQPTVRRQVISEQTAATVASMMESVVTNGTGSRAYVAGYRVAGKTGTSQKYNKSGIYIASFACFAPADDPELAVLIIVDEPQVKINGGEICTKVAAKVIEKSLEYMGVEKQYSEGELDMLDTTTPNLVNLSVDEAENLLSTEEFTVKVIGDGDTVINQVPAYNQTIPKDGLIVLYTEKDSEPMQATVPNLLGMSLTQVNKYAVASGLNIRISGNALNEGKFVSFVQDIEPGTQVDYGTTITVSFESIGGTDDLAE